MGIEIPVCRLGSARSERTGHQRHRWPSREVDSRLRQICRVSGYGRDSRNRSSGRSSHCSWRGSLRGRGTWVLVVEAGLHIWRKGGREGGYIGGGGWEGGREGRRREGGRGGRRRGMGGTEGRREGGRVGRTEGGREGRRRGVGGTEGGREGGRIGGGG